MKDVNNQPFHWDRNPQDIVFIKQAPTKAQYLKTWFAHIEAHNIKYGLPNIEDAFPLAWPFESNTIFWLPSVGIIKLDKMVFCWLLREPYASLGAHTRLCCGVQFHKIASLGDLSNELAEHIQHPKYASKVQHYHKRKIPERYSLMRAFGVEETLIDQLIELGETPITSKPDGVCCYFDRGGERDNRPKLYRGYSSTDELLARTVMLQFSTKVEEAHRARLLM